MRNLALAIATIAFMVGMTLEADAQGRGNGHRGKHKKEYAAKHRKYDKGFHKRANNNKAYWKYAEKRDREYRKYYEKRDREYRKYVKQRGHRYRDHDDWYYGERFHHRNEYVYFPKYRTYYDPYRRGYVYRRNNAWVFAQTMPSFMMGVNIGGLNVQFMANVPL